MGFTTGHQVSAAIDVGSLTVNDTAQISVLNITNKIIFSDGSELTSLPTNQATNSVSVAGATGPQGPQGETGATGAAGISVTGAVVTNGNLIITRSDGSTINAGSVSASSASAPAGVRMVGGAPNPFAPVIVSAPPGYKAANIDDGVELSLDTLAVQLAPSGNRSLQFRVTTGTLTVNITGQIYWAKGDYSGNWDARYWNGSTLNTTWQQPFTWSFPWQGDMAIYNVQDVTNRRFYRITLSIGGGYKKNTIIIERMV